MISWGFYSDPVLDSYFDTNCLQHFPKFKLSEQRKITTIKWEPNIGQFSPT